MLKFLHFFFIPEIIAVASQKGGVGKTTTVLNLGATLHKEGRRVLLVALIFTAMAYGIVAILLVFAARGGLMRLALIDMLFVLSPVAALLWMLPQTQGCAGGPTSSRSRCSSRRSR